MLQEPAAFATAVQGLLQAQRLALAVGAQAGGEHLCFLGSGRQEEDRYTHMVVASFLQKHTQYVSMVTAGYQGRGISDIVEILYKPITSMPIVLLQPYTNTLATRLSPVSSIIIRNIVWYAAPTCPRRIRTSPAPPKLRTTTPTSWGSLRK